MTENTQPAGLATPSTPSQSGLRMSPNPNPCPLARLAAERIDWMDRTAAMVEHLQGVDALGKLGLEERCHLFNALRALEYYFADAVEAW